MRFINVKPDNVVFVKKEV